MAGFMVRVTTFRNAVPPLRYRRRRRLYRLRRFAAIPRGDDRGTSIPGSDFAADEGETVGPVSVHGREDGSLAVKRFEAADDLPDPFRGVVADHRVIGKLEHAIGSMLRGEPPAAFLVAGIGVEHEVDFWRKSNKPPFASLQSFLGFQFTSGIIARSAASPDLTKNQPVDP
jgi:hypothetical protein